MSQHQITTTVPEVLSLGTGVHALHEMLDRDGKLSSQAYLALERAVALGDDVFGYSIGPAEDYAKWIEGGTYQVYVNVQDTENGPAVVSFAAVNLLGEKEATIMNKYGEMFRVASLDYIATHEGHRGNGYAKGVLAAVDTSLVSFGYGFVMTLHDKDAEPIASSNGDAKTPLEIFIGHFGSREVADVRWSEISAPDPITGGFYKTEYHLAMRGIGNPPPEFPIGGIPGSYLAGVMQAYSEVDQAYSEVDPVSPKPGGWLIEQNPENEQHVVDILERIRGTDLFVVL